MQQTDERKASGSGSYEDVYGRWLQACMGRGPSSIATDIPPAVTSYVSSVPVAPIETPNRVPSSFVSPRDHERAWALLQSPAENVARKEQTVRIESAATVTEHNLNNTLEAAKVARQEAEALLSRVSTSRQRDNTAPVTLSLLERMKLSQNTTAAPISEVTAPLSDDISNSISATYEAALARLRQDQQSSHPVSYSKALDGLVAASPQQHQQQQQPTTPQPVSLIDSTGIPSTSTVVPQVGQIGQVGMPSTSSEEVLPNPSSLPSPVHASVTPIAAAIQQVEGNDEVPHQSAAYSITKSDPSVVAGHVCGQEPVPSAGIQSPPPTTSTSATRGIISPTPLLHNSPHKEEGPSTAYLNSVLQLRSSSPPLPKVPSFSQPAAGSVYGRMLAEVRSPESLNFQLSPEADKNNTSNANHLYQPHYGSTQPQSQSQPQPQQPQTQHSVAATPPLNNNIHNLPSPSSLISPDPVALKQAADLLEGKSKVNINESSETGLGHQPKTALWTVGSDDPCEEIAKAPSDTAIRSPTYETTKVILSQPYDAAVGRLRAQEQLASIPPPQPVPQSTVAYLNLTSSAGVSSELVSPPHPGERRVTGESEDISPVRPPTSSPAKVSFAPMPQDLPPPVKAVVDTNTATVPVVKESSTVSVSNDVKPFVSEYDIRSGNQHQQPLSTAEQVAAAIPEYSHTYQTGHLITEIPKDFVPIRVPSDGSPAPLSTPSQLSPLSDFKSPTRVSMSPIMNPVRVGSTITASRDNSLMNINKEGLINSEIGKLNMSLVGSISDRMNIVEERSPSPLPTPRSAGSTPSPVPNPRLSIPQPTSVSPVAGRRPISSRGRGTGTGAVRGATKKVVPSTTTAPSPVVSASLNFDPTRMRKPHVPRLSKKALQSEGVVRQPRSSIKPQPWTPPAATKTRSFRVEDVAKPVRTTTPVTRKARSSNQLIETVYSTSNVKSSFARQ